MQAQAIQNLVHPQLEAVDQLIAEQLRSNISLIEAISRHIIHAGGKRLRPLLVLLAGGSVGPLGSNHIAVAAIVEFIHTATLLHDDVVDGATIRRGKPAANVQWGNASSVLVGDFLYTRAFQLLLEVANHEVTTLLTQTTRTLTEGEMLQLMRVGDMAMDEGDYLQVIENKTAILFAAAAASGALLTIANASPIEQLYQYGLNIGMAFQLIDDTLDYEGATLEMGKQRGSALAEGKLTLPLIYTMQHGSAKQRTLIEQAIKHRQRDAIDDIYHAVNDSGALAYSRQVAKRYGQRALAQLQGFRDTPYQEALEALVALAIARHH